MKDADNPPPLAITPRWEVTRRDALKLLAAGIAALETGCLESAGSQDIVPYVVEPPEMRPGVTVRYASAIARDGFGIGVLVDSHDGRPTKLDGNPLHPAALGGSMPWLQASILDLYDPQRLREVRLDGMDATWDEIAARLQHLPKGQLWIVMPPQSSPTIADLLARAATGRDLHVVYDAPLDHRNAYRGSALAFGRPLEQQLDLKRADVIAALDADFYAAMPMSAAWSRAAAARRTPDRRMSRTWVCEAMQTPTGTIADERLAIPAGAVAAVAVVVAARLGELGLHVPRLAGGVVAQAQHRLGAQGLAWARALAEDLHAHRGAGAVIVGDRQPPAVHALARAIDGACGNIGGPVTFTEPALLDPLGGATLDDLAAAIAANRVGAVLVLDCNPAYTAPNGLALFEALQRVPFSLHLALHPDETGPACKAVAPLAHPLETWSDPRAWTGTLAIAQPAIRPRFPVASIVDVLAALAGDARSAQDLVRARFAAVTGATPVDADARWKDALRRGVVPNTDAPAVKVTPTWQSSADAELARVLADPPAGTIELALAPSVLGDGRHSANAWLQELPHPITKQTWGNAALLGPATAGKLGVGNEDLLRIETARGAVTVPALIVTGAAEGSITIEVGYGRRAAGLAIPDHVGTDVYPLRQGAEQLLAAHVKAAGGTGHIIRTQGTTDQSGRKLAQVATLGGFLRDPSFTEDLRGDQVSLLPRMPEVTEGVQWGMSIDTSICTGCSACMVACQAENNIPCVGPEGVDKSRHMNWIRVDRWVLETGEVVNEPLPCQHCENAPCEYVCPVNATTHSADGLNEQIYNRCIGTRFCSNNCPYKVRRFNFFAYESHDERALQYNPDVTVRERGVMEKCTYCVQRIRGAEHRALVEKRAIRPGEVVTACQAACPTNAIVFGELHEVGTRFAEMRKDPRRFDQLFELGTRPRTQYLAKIKNPRGGGA